MITKPLTNRLSEIMQSYDLKFSRTQSTMQAEDTSQEDEPPSTMMSDRLLEGGREHIKQKEGSTANNVLQNTLKPGDKLKELLNRKHAIRN